MMLLQNLMKLLPNHIMLWYSLGYKPQKSLLQGLRFFCIFEKSGKNEATDLAVSQLWGSTIAIISAHVPGQHMWASAGPGPSSSSPKQWKSDGRVKIYNSVSARSPLTKCKKKNYRERSNIKSARVSALTGSAPRKMAEAQQRFSTHQELNPCLPHQEYWELNPCRPTLCNQS